MVKGYVGLGLLRAEVAEWLFDCGAQHPSTSMQVVASCWMRDDEVQDNNKAQDDSKSRATQLRKRPARQSNKAIRHEGAQRVLNMEGDVPFIVVLHHTPSLDLGPQWSGRPS